MPDTAIFLCDWQVQGPWQQQTRQKVKGQAERKELNKSLEELLRYNVPNPGGKYTNEELQAMGKHQLEAFYSKYIDLTAFIQYFKGHWEGKMGASSRPFCCPPSRKLLVTQCHVYAERWMQLFRNKAYMCNQNTIGPVLTFHRNLKVSPHIWPSPPLVLKVLI